MTLEVSKITLGCWALAGGMEWGDQSEQLSIDTIHAALDQGITSLDTAPMYGKGKSEEILGNALQGRRNGVFIADKISPGVSTESAIQESCENSLKLLQTDVIDLMQVHWPDHYVPFEETVAALVGLRDAGKIRHIGICNFGAIDTGHWLEASGPVYLNQLPYSLLSRSIEYEIVPHCLDHGIGILAYSSIMQGLLSGKFKTAAEVPDSRARTRHFSSERALTRHGGPGCEGETFAAIAEVQRIANSLGTPMSRLALAWVLQKSVVTSVIVGARNPDQIIENVKANDLVLDEQTMTALEEATNSVKSFLGRNPDLWSAESRYAL